MDPALFPDDSNHRVYRAQKNRFAQPRAELAALIQQPHGAATVTDKTVAYLIHILTGITPVARNDNHPNDCAELLNSLPADIQSVLRHTTSVIQSLMQTPSFLDNSGPDGA